MADLTEYRASSSEQLRIHDLLRHVTSGEAVLDIGARDGYISILLSNCFEMVVALDLKKSDIQHSKVRCLIGNAADLPLVDGSMDYVICAEVLEHLPAAILQKASLEIQRVTRRYLVIGVPYKQDIRCERTACSICGTVNPPWGHINAFDEDRLKQLFPSMEVVAMSFVGENKMRTNHLSAFLMRLAKNPFGTYSQEEGCINCGGKLVPPAHRTILQKALAKTACYIDGLQRPFIRARPNWIHMLLKKYDHKP